jgi:hypothetical protein
VQCPGRFKYLPWKNKEYSYRRIRYILVKEGALFEKNKAHSASRIRCTLMEEQGTPFWKNTRNTLLEKEEHSLGRVRCIVKEEKCKLSYEEKVNCLVKAIFTQQRGITRFQNTLYLFKINHAHPAGHSCIA